MVLRLRSLLSTDEPRAVSPLVSTILMVAITVVLAAVVSVFALGILDGVSDPAPTADFDAEFTDSGDVRIQHAQGDTIDGDRVFLKISDASGSRTLGWTDLGGSADVSAGSVVTASGLNGDETVRVVWESETGAESATLRTFQTRGITAPLSSASSQTEAGTFVSNSGLFGTKAWQALGRAGNRGPSGDWEIGIGPNDAGSDGQANIAWQNGDSYPFTLTYNQNGNGEATFAIDGKAVDSDVDSFSTTGDTIGFTLVNETTDQSVMVENLRLDGLRLQRSTAQSGVDGGRETAYTVSKDSIADGFVFTGQVTFSWGTTTPSGSDIQLNIAIEEAGTDSS